MFKRLEDQQTHFHRGHLVLIAAGPGVGKSAFALNLALKSKVSCLYISADSDAFTQESRSLSILSGWRYEASAKALRDKDYDKLDQYLTGLPIRFTYSASPSLGEIAKTVEAYDEVYGDFPALIVVDNITNVRTEVSEEDGDPFSGLEGLMDELHTMARATEACVIGLHHVTGGFNDADKPVPLSGLKNQIGRVPEMVLTLHKRADALCVSTVKNRAGKADPSGFTFAELEFDSERMIVKE